MASITGARSYYANPYRKYIDTDPGVLLILARHGATGANDATTPLVRGWEDIPLDNHGQIEAQLLGIRLRKYEPTKVISSDFMRDQETANILANSIRTNDIETDYDLRTWDVGYFSGQPLIDVNPAIEQIYKEPWRKPPGSSETFNEFTARFTNALQRYLTLATIDIYRPLLLVTHGKNIAMANTYITGGNSWESKMPKPSGIAVISVNQDRSLSIKLDEPTENVIEDI